MNYEEIKKEIREIFLELLRLDTLDSDDVSFLELGGDSFEFTKLQMTIKKKYSEKIPLKTLYRNNSVNGIADILYASKSKHDETEKDDSRQPLSITDMQKVVFVGRNESVTLGGTASKTYFELLCKEYDSEKFYQTAMKIVNMHTSTRMAYTNDNTCRVVDGYQLSIPEYDLRGLSRDKQEKQLAKARDRQFNLEFDVTTPPLIAFSVSILDEHNAVIHVSYDGLVSDGEGLEILISEIDKAYRGEELPQPCTFEEYYNYVSSLKKSDEYIEDEKYWRKMVNSVSHRPKLPMKVRPEVVKKASSEQIVKYFSMEEYKKLGEISKKTGVTLFAFLFTLFGKTLSLYSKNNSFFINVPMSVRPSECKNIENTIALCANFTFVHFDDSENLTISETAVKTQETLFDCHEHSAYIGTDVLKIFQERIGASIPAPITFTSTVDSDRSEDLQYFKKQYVRTHTSQNWIEVLLTKCDGKIAFLMNYEEDILSEDIANGIADCFVENVKRLIDNPDLVNSVRNFDVPKKDLEIIQSRVFFDKGEPYSFVSLAEKLNENFRTCRDKTAIAWEDGQLTYGQVYEKAQSFLYNLKKASGGHLPKRVALFMEKSPEQVIVSVACVCAGVSYLPFETELPIETVMSCVAKVHAEAVVVSPKYQDLFEDKKINIIRSDETVFLVGTDENYFIQVDKIKPEDEILMINTSGTTGIPKSISIAQKGLSHCLINTPHLFGLPQNPVGIAVTSIAHDLSLFDTLGLLMYQGTVVVPTDKKRKEPSHWAELMEKYHVSVWNSVPAFMEMFTLVDKNVAEKAAKNLKTVMLGGDWVRPVLVRKIQEIAPNASVISIGGPSETTLWNIYHKVKKDDLEAELIPYGKPFPNTSYNILNHQMALCPIGVTGKMYVSGISVSNGYIGNDEENEKRFTEYEGKRVYDTGDIGKYLPDGQIRIMGRDDFQVKINGKRIELVGIENAITLYDPILSACVVVNEKTNKLWGFYSSDIEIDEGKLREHLKQSLQDYMIPSNFVRVSEIPLTLNGKVNRKKLQQLTDSFKKSDEFEENISEKTEALNTETKDALTENDIEQRLLSACREIMDDDDIDIEDDFYSMGGDSIAAMKLSAWIKQEYCVDVAVYEILNSPNISDWAALIEERK